MGQSLSDWERLEAVIRWSNMTINYFARHIGLSRSETLYQIKRGGHNISRTIAQRIVDTFPELSYSWLLSGEGSMFATEELRGEVIPFFDLELETSLREALDSQACSSIMLPKIEPCDIAIKHRGAILMLKKICPQEIINGREYALLTKNIVTLRRATLNGLTLHLDAEDDCQEQITISLMEVEAAFDVVARVLFN
ncbi:MAG: helix-turn-helix transcriptional regulator [Rikenellaceae bacterium]